MPSKRRLIQVYAALLYNANIKGFITGDIFKGNTKYACVPGLNCYSCPGAVGACPLGALQNAFSSSGTRTPYYVFGIIILFGLMLGRTICGFLCPFGLIQELLYKIRTPKLKKNRVTRVVSYLKYVLLVVLVVAIPIMFGLTATAVPGFCKYICPAGTFEGAIGLLINSANDGLFALLDVLFTWKFAVFVIVVVACVFIYRMFCRFICPLGALYGFFSKVALLGVKLDKNKCTDCGLCIDVCQMDIKHVGDHECIHCGKCISVCPAKAISWKGSKILLHPNAVAATPEGAVAEKPLNNLLKTEANGTFKVTTVNSAETIQNVESTGSIKTDNQTALELVNKEESSTPTKAVSVDKIKRRNLILECVAWGLAVVLLISALVYFNFIDKPVARAQGNQVGDICPDFTLQKYGRNGDEYVLTDEVFNLQDTRGKVTVVNFWATWCGPCVQELPYFEELQKLYPEEVQVVAVHSVSITEESVPAYLVNQKWSDWQLTFLQDAVADDGYDAYTALGGIGTLPTTLVLDKDGVITYNSAESIKSLDDLIKLVKPNLEIE